MIRKLLGLGLRHEQGDGAAARRARVERSGPSKVARLEPQYPQGNPVIVDPGVSWSGDARRPARADRRGARGDRLVPGAGRLEQLGRVGRALGDGHAAARLRPAPDHERCPTSGTRPTSPATTTGLRGATDARLTRSPCSGRPAHVAWGFTNVMADTQDLFVERIRDPRRRPDVRVRGRVAQPEIVHRGDPVKGRVAPRRWTCAITHHGPIVNDALGARAERAAGAVVDRPPVPGADRAPACDRARARSGEELVEAVGGYHVPPLNMLWADDDGQHRLPARREAPDPPRQLPGPAEAGLDRRVRVGGLRALRRPARAREPAAAAFIVTANNRIVGDDYPHHITSEWMTGYRAARIEQLLGERERHSLEDFERMQHDFFSIPGERDGAPAVAPAPERPARGARDRAPQELGRQARSRDRRRHDLRGRSRCTFARLVRWP